ncbi:hypothetical protein [Alloactinosynnema sp. L-07]|nr:hypothetical protein [Alloactinosynnema sp. L-07]
MQNGPRRGFMSIMLVPANTALMQQPPWADRPSGTTGSVVDTKSGQVMIVVIEPLAGSIAPPVDGSQARAIAEELAARF